jgi:hypothetical protein
MNFPHAKIYEELISPIPRFYLRFHSREGIPRARMTSTITEKRITASRVMNSHLSIELGAGSFADPCTKLYASIPSAARVSAVKKIAMNWIFLSKR